MSTMILFEINSKNVILMLKQIIT